MIDGDAMIQATLDRALQALQTGEVHAALQAVCEHLHDLRQQASSDFWTGVIRPTCDVHPIGRIVLEDPFTRRARNKPRGYAGDAEMIDYLYNQVAPAGTTAAGQQVFAFTTSAPSGKAVRWRLSHLADTIDQTASEHPHCRVLSLACGHLREAGLSQAVRGGAVSVLHAIDQDPVSLAVVRRDYADIPCMSAAEGSVRQILKFGIPHDELHLAYAAGLYDYLEIGAAQALTRRLFDALAPGGRLIVPNFLRTNFARGYMESFMDWHLIVRDRTEIESIGASLLPDDVAESRYFEDPFGVVGYLEVVRRDRT